MADDKLNDPFIDYTARPKLPRIALLPPADGTATPAAPAVVEASIRDMTGRAHVVACPTTAALLTRALAFLAAQGLTTAATTSLAGPIVAAAAKDAGVTLGDELPVNPDLSPSVDDLQARYANDRFDILVLPWPGGFITPAAPMIRAWCERQAVVLVEDASDALGSRAATQPAGAFGEIAVFTVAGRGVLVTDVEELAMAVRREAPALTDDLAGQMVHAIASVPQHTDRRRRWARLYDRHYLPKCGVVPLGDRSDSEANYAWYPVLLPKPTDRIELPAFLQTRSIEIGLDPLPHLPLHHALTQEDVERVGGALLEFYLGR